MESLIRKCRLVSEELVVGVDGFRGRRCGVDYRVVVTFWEVFEDGAVE
jgi:hypothetical protein